MSALLMPQDQVNMDELIDLLWMQDMDMGFSRDLYDPVKQQEYQKQQEHQKQQELEKQKELEQMEAMLYTTDPETGEKIPINSILAQFYQQPSEPTKVEMEIHPEVTDDLNLDELESLLNPDMEVDPMSSCDFTPIPAAAPKLYNERKPVNIKQEPEIEDVWGLPMDSPPDVFDDMMMYERTQQKPPYGQQSEVDDFNSQFVGSPFSSLSSGSPYSAHTADYKMTPPSLWGAVDSEMTRHLELKPKALEFPYHPRLDVKPAVDKEYELMRRGRSKDVERAKLLGIPFSVADVIDLPVDDFSDMMKTEQLNDEQLAVIRDIRRRGKNKVAAQNCRKKKISELTDLESEIEELRKKKQALVSDKINHAQSLVEVHSLVEQTQAELLYSLRDGSGKPYNPSLYMVDVTENGNVFVVQRPYM